MHHFEKQFLNLAIAKWRKPHFTQAQLCDGICSKYTLSRLENGMLCKERMYHNILARMGFVYEDTIDMLTVYLLFRDCLIHIQANHQKSIKTCIHKIENIIQQHHNHIFFHDLKTYLHHMKTHYLKHLPLSLTKEDITTLSCYPKDIFLCLFHTLCENALLYDKVDTLFFLLETFPYPHHTMTTDYFIMAKHVIEHNIVDCDTIFKRYKTELLETNQHYQYIRFATLQAISYIEIDKEHALCLFHRIMQIIKKTKIQTPYSSLLYKGYLHIFILMNKLEDALSSAVTLFHFGKEYKDYAIPYLVFLHISLKKELPDEYTITDASALSYHALTYYQRKRRGDSPKALLHYINQNFPKQFLPPPTKETLLSLIHKEVFYLVEESRSYKSGLLFDTQVKLYTRKGR